MEVEKTTEHYRVEWQSAMLRGQGVTVTIQEKKDALSFNFSIQSTQIFYEKLF